MAVAGVIKEKSIPVVDVEPDTNYGSWSPLFMVTHGYPWLAHETMHGLRADLQALEMGGVLKCLPGRLPRAMG